MRSQRASDCGLVSVFDGASANRNFRLTLSDFVASAINEWAMLLVNNNTPIKGFINRSVVSKQINNFGHDMPVSKSVSR